MQHVDFDGDDAQRVAVGLGRGDGRMADHALAAGAVHHVDRLAQLFLKDGRDRPAGGVGAAAGAPRDDQGDRAGRIAGSQRRTRQQAQCPESGRPLQDLAAIDVFEFSHLRILPIS